MPRAPLHFALVLFALLGVGCTAPAAELDAGPPDAGAIETDAGMENPWAERPPLRRDGGAPAVDASCPPRDEPSAMRSFELDPRGFRLGSADATPEGGLWITGTAADLGQPLALHLGPEGALEHARSLPLTTEFAARGATREDGGLHLAYVAGGTLVVASLDARGELDWIAKLDPGVGFRFDEAPLVADDLGGFYVAVAIRSGDRGARGVQLVRFASDGTTSWQRQVFGPRTFAVPTALGSGSGGALLVLRTDGFSERTYLPTGTDVEAHTSAPWVLRFGEDGALRWQRFFDADVGDNLVLDVVTRREGAWVLGGGTDPVFQEPWLLEVRDDGTMTSSTVLEGIPSTRVAGLRIDGDHLEVIQGSSLNVMVGRVSSATVGVSELLALDGQLALATGTARGVFFVGPLPSCSDADRLGVRDLDPFCAARRDLGVAWLPAGRAGTCLRSLEDDPWTEQTVEHPLTLVSQPDVAPLDSALEATFLPLEASSLSPRTDRHCFAGGACPSTL